MQHFGHNGNGNMEHTIERLRHCLPVRLLTVLADLHRRKFEGRLVLNYRSGAVLSIEPREIEYLDRRR